VSGSTDRDLECAPSCEREEEMEELVLGTLSPSRAAAARGHLSSCGACAEAHRRFAEERALFTSRAAVIIAPPPSLRRASLASRVLPPSRDLWSVTRVAAAALACAAAIVCVFREPSAGSTPAITSEARSSVEADPATNMHASSRASFAIDEGLACAYPASGVAPRIGTVRPIRNGALASVAPRGLAFASNDVGVCEEQPAISSGQ
jgi:hypothetical protein